MVRRHPIAVAFVFAFAAWAGLAMQVLAEEATLGGSVEAVGLHDGPLDMEASYAAERRGALPVTATFAARTASMMSAAPMRLEMALGDGDDVTVSVPGYPQVVYRFLRNGGDVTVSVRRVPGIGPLAAGL